MAVGCRRNAWGRLCLAGVALLLALPAGSAEAARTEEFRAAAAADLLGGEFDGVALAADGALVPAPAETLWFADQVAYVWRLVPAEDGVWAATGSQGALYRLTGPGQAEVVAQTLEYELFAIARGPQDGLRVAGAPNGTITRVGRDGGTETLADLPEGLVWDLAFGPSGELYAATGEGGRVYRIQPDGAAEVFATVPDAHVVAFAWWHGRLICGTDGRGLLLAIDPADGSVEVLFDAAGEEVVALLAQEERLLFAANGGAAHTGGEGSGDPLVLPVIEVRPESAAAQNATLYALDRQGFARAVWHAPERHILSLAAAPRGGVLVGTGSEGVLYGLDSLWNATRLLDLDEADILSLLPTEDGLFVGTGNGGSVYRLDWAGQRTGRYTSRVYDAGRTVRWGRPYWVRAGEGQVAFATRSGQTADPDESWSPWAALEGERIASPAARFLQWRIELRATAQQGLRIGPIGVPYRGPNRAPRISSLEVTPKAPLLSPANGAGAPVRQTLPGGVQVEYSLSGENGSERQRPGPGYWARTLRSASWQAEDPDGDALRFDLFLRMLEDEGFMPLKRDLDAPAWTWEAAAWPDGWYQLKVVARDATDNPPQEALEAVRLSAPFQIDNMPPQLHALAVTGQPGDYRLVGWAQDAGSRLQSLEFSLDGESWQPGLPLDGIFDDRVEEFEIPLPATEDGEPPSVVGVRVADEVGHVATGRVRVAGH